MIISINNKISTVKKDLNKACNHHNNTPENLVTLCSICHTRKTKNLATSIHKGNHQESNKKTLNHIIKGVGVFILLLFL